MIIEDIGRTIRNACGSEPDLSTSIRGTYNHKYGPFQRDILNSLYERTKKEEIWSVEYRTDCSLDCDNCANHGVAMSETIKGFRSRLMVVEVSQGLAVKKRTIRVRRDGTISSQDFIVVLWNTAWGNSESSERTKDSFGLIPKTGRNWRSLGAGSYANTTTGTRKAGGRRCREKYCYRDNGGYFVGHETFRFQNYLPSIIKKEKRSL